MNSANFVDQPLMRRELLKAGGTLAIAAVPALTPVTTTAQAPKRGGTLRLTFQADPLHFDPHQFVTMVPLSFAYSRVVKVKAGRLWSREGAGCREQTFRQLGLYGPMLSATPPY